jgi:hypothetical protein
MHQSTHQDGKVSAINIVDDTTEMMLISQFGRIIRITDRAGSTGFGAKDPRLRYARYAWGAIAGDQSPSELFFRILRDLPTLTPSTPAPQK